MARSQILIAIVLTLVPGLSTGIGGFISFFAKAGDSRVLAAGLELSAGVMVYVSFMELLPQAMEHMELTMSPVYAKLWSLVAFFGGMALIAAIDWLIPEDETPTKYIRSRSLNKTTATTSVARASCLLWPSPYTIFPKASLRS